MALVLADRVRETTTTTGTGTISLAGPVSGFQGFSTGVGNANTTYYTIVDAATGAWEVGLGTYTSSGSTLSRDTVFSSSNSGSLVPFAAGTKDVFVTQPAERAVYVLGAGTGLAAGAAAFTANGVPYADSTSTLATSSNLTFNGTTLTANALTTTSTVTLNGGTAGGVAYLNGSKVLTSGSALTFDGTNLGVNVTPIANQGRIQANGSGQSWFKFYDSSAGWNFGTFYKANGTSALAYLGGGGGSAIAGGTVDDFVVRAEGNMLFAISTAEQMRLTSTGLGIGTSSPGSFEGTVKTVIGGGSGSPVLTLYGGNATYSGIYFADGTTGNEKYRGFFEYDHATDALRVGTAGATKATLDSSGNLGIGTSSPGERLTVQTALTGTTAGSNTVGRFQSNGNGYDANIALGDNVNASARLGYLSGNMYFWTNGAERARVDTSGNLGLGVTPSAWAAGWNAQQIGYSYGLMASSSVNAWYQLNNSYFDGSFKYKNNGVASSYEQGTVPHVWKIAPSGTAGNAITFTQAMTLTAGGDLLVGPTSGSDPESLGTPYINVKGAVYAMKSSDTSKYVAIGAAGTAGYVIAQSGLDSLRLYAGGSERARITSGGDLLVGTTTNAQGSGDGNKLIAGGAVWVVNAATADGFSYYNSAAAAYRFYVSSGGTISATNTTISAISDQRLKENIQDLDIGLDKIMALKPRKFDWKEGKGKDIKGDRGFIAQEFEQVFPDMIDTWKDEAPEGEEPYKSVRADLIPVLVKAIQELKAEVDSLKAQLKGA